MIIKFEKQVENPKCIKFNDAVVNIVTKEIVFVFFIKTFHRLMYKISLSISQHTIFCWKYKVKYLYFKFICLLHISYSFNSVHFNYFLKYKYQKTFLIMTYVEKTSEFEVALNGHTIANKYIHTLFENDQYLLWFIS